MWCYVIKWVVPEVFKGRVVPPPSVVEKPTNDEFTADPWKWRHYIPSKCHIPFAWFSITSPRPDSLIIPLHKSQSLHNGKCWLPKSMAVVTCAHLWGRHVCSNWSLHFWNKHRSWRWRNLRQLGVSSTGLHNHLSAQQVCWTNRHL